MIQILSADDGSTSPAMVCDQCDLIISSGNSTSRGRAGLVLWPADEWAAPVAATVHRGACEQSWLDLHGPAWCSAGLTSFLVDLIAEFIRANPASAARYQAAVAAAVAADAPVRRCANCSAVLPASMNPRARACSTRCANAVQYRRSKAAKLAGVAL